MIMYNIVLHWCWCLIIIIIIITITVTGNSNAAEVTQLSFIHKKISGYNMMFHGSIVNYFNCYNWTTISLSKKIFLFMRSCVCCKNSFTWVNAENWSPTQSVIFRWKTLSLKLNQTSKSLSWSDFNLHFNHTFVRTDSSGSPNHVSQWLKKSNPSRTSHFLNMFMMLLIISLCL